MDKFVFAQNGEAKCSVKYQDAIFRKASQELEKYLKQMINTDKIE